jgi:tetratricopeptide (TPR) repeat protein
MVGPFRLERLLGKGGMGAVFAARHPTGAEVAVKVLEVEDPEEGPKLLERFKREVSAMVRIGRHPNLVRVHTAGTHGASPYVVMELVPGKDLSKRIGKQPMEPALAARVVEKVARAVHHCHEQGVIHRDLKPANVLLRDDGEPVVTDFGLAREDTAERMTKTGELVGTPSYMAPEQVEGQRDAQDRRTDVYALGAILYECLTGEPPFGADSKAALVKQILLEDPVSARKKVAAVPEDLDVIAAKCLEKEQGARYQTALELADELARYCRGEPIVARPLSSAEKRRRWLKRHGREAVLGSIGLTALLALSVALGIRFAFTEKEPFDGLVTRAASMAVQDGYPERPAALSPGTAAALDALRLRPTELAQVSTARVLLRWGDLVRDRAATLRLDPPDDPVAHALDAVASLADPGLLELASRRAKEPEKRMLEAHRTPTLERLVAAYSGLGEGERHVWARTFDEDAAAAFRRAIDGKEPAPRPATLITLGYARGAATATLASPADWTKLVERVDWKPPRDAVTFASSFDPKQPVGGAAVAAIGSGLAARSRALLAAAMAHAGGGTGIEGALDADARRPMFELTIAAVHLGYRPDPLRDLDPLFRGSGAIDPEKRSALERVYIFALYLEIGFTPQADDLKLPNSRAADERRAHNDALRVAAKTLDEDLDTTACRLTRALALLEIAFSLDPDNFAGPTAERDVVLEEALARLRAVGPELRGNLLAVERFEYANVLIRLRAPFKGFKDVISPYDPEALATAGKALQEAEGLHRRVQLMEAREDVTERWLWRACDMAAPAAADEALAACLELLSKWEEALAGSVAEGNALTALSEDEMSPEQRLRHFELSYCYTGKTTVQRPNMVVVEFGLRRYKALNMAAVAHARAHDEAGARKHYQTALDTLDKLTSLDIGRKEKAAEVHVKRALLLLELGRPQEAVEAAQLSLKLEDDGWDRVRGDLTLARALKVLGRTEEARAAAQESFKIAKSIGNGPQDWSESEALLETLK